MLLLVALALALFAWAPGADEKQGLGSVRSWFSYLDVNLEPAVVDRIARSDYELVVIDPIVTERNNADYPIAATVRRLQTAARPKLVLAYVDIGQAEDYRRYWRRGWRNKPPWWVLGADPDGWEGNYPVAYWAPAWRDIWLRRAGIVDVLLRAGFDGMYLDWTEGHSDPRVRARARKDGRKATAEMVRWVRDLAARARATDPEFFVVNQNAAELPVRSVEFRELIDAQASEQVWFDGAADDDPPGDCPLPARDADVESRRYLNRLSAECRKLHDDFPGSTLWTSSESYLRDVTRLRAAGVPVLTVDYAITRRNVQLAHCRALARGFVPFASNRALDAWRPRVRPRCPPGRRL